jgi:hypothetical protein
MISAGVASAALGVACFAQTPANSPSAKPAAVTTTTVAPKAAPAKATATTLAAPAAKTPAPPKAPAPTLAGPPKAAPAAAKPPAAKPPAEKPAGQAQPAAPKPKKEKAAPTTTLPERPAVVQSKTQPSLDVVRLGYNRLLRPGQWAPVQLVLKNPTAKAAEVKVVIFAEEPDGTRQPMVTHTELRLPPYSTRWHTTYALVDRCDRVVVELYDAGRFASRQTVEPFVAGAREMLSVAFSAGTETYGCRQDEDAKDPVGRMRFHNPAAVEDLPARWAGYDPIDVIIIGALPAEGLTVVQETAIVDWVRAGGLLILSPGLQPDRYAGTVIDSISPVRVLGARKVQDIPVLTKQYGPFVNRPEGIGLVECAVRDGVVQQRDGLFPLVVVRREGAGAVAFVAVDLSSERVTGWLGLKRFYRSLIDGTDRLPRTGGTQSPVVATEALNQAVGVRVLPRGAVALVMGLYLAGVVGALYFMRGRREWAFVVVIVAAPVLAVVINFVGLAASGVTGTTVAGLHVVRSKAGETGAFATSYYALLSPDEAKADLSLPDRPSSFLSAPIAQPAEISKNSAAAAETARETVDFLDGDVKSLDKLHIRPRGISTFESIHGATMPGALDVKAAAGPDGLRVQVTNRSNRTVRRAFVVCNRNVAALGDLGAGATQSVTLSARSAASLMSGFAGDGGLRSREDVERDRLFASLYARPSGSTVINTGVMVTGWLDGAPAELKVTGFSDAPQTTSRTLWLVGADLLTPPGRLLFPKGTLALALSQTKGAFDNGRWQPTTVVRTMDVEFVLPPAARALKPSRIEFHLATTGAAPVASVEVLNAETGQYELLHGKAGKPRPEPVGLNRNRFTLASPDKCLNPALGAVRLRLAFGPESATAITSPGARQPVTLSDCDLEIEGTLE